MDKLPLYKVQLDFRDIEEIFALSLAEVANKIRGKAKVSVLVWSPANLLLIDATPERGDQYDLLLKPDMK